ncbi:MAG: D-alanyl-D-alanine carboxypeptidase family protein [Clostridia bacterium]|nr:D-alanyl-D-alanine carboxypeptidase family protein [Clostridia bacterium]
MVKNKKDRAFYAVAAAVALLLICVILVVALTGRGEGGASSAAETGAESAPGAESGRESSGTETGAPEQSEASTEASAEASAEVSEETSAETDESSAAEPKEKPLLINKDHGLPEDYDTGELVNAYEQSGRNFQLSVADMKLRPEVYEALNRMCGDAAAQGVTGYILTDAFRPRAEQERLYSELPAGIAAPPGFSEHETGLAFDISAYSKNGDFGETPQFEWLYAHCAEYGFILRYPQGKEEITGITYEPWHYRYVGVEIAAEIMGAGITLEEYCGEWPADN